MCPTTVPAYLGLPPLSSETSHSCSLGMLQVPVPTDCAQGGEMDHLFMEGRIGTMSIPNRMVRSATAEWLADESGRPRPPMIDLY